MPTEREIEARQRMGQGFFPLDASTEYRIAAEEEYSAFYLGEIAKALNQLAISVVNLDKTLAVISAKMPR